MSCLSICPSVRVSGRNTSSTSKRILMVWCLNIFLKSVEKIQDSRNLTRIISLYIKTNIQGDSVARGPKLFIDNSLVPLATESPCTFLVTSHLVLLRMKNTANRFAEKIKTHILCSVTIFFYRKS